MFKFANESDASVTQELTDGDFAVWSISTLGDLTVRIVSTGNSYHRPVMLLTLPDDIFHELQRRVNNV